MSRPVTDVGSEYDSRACLHHLNAAASNGMDAISIPAAHPLLTISTMPLVSA